MEAWSFGTCRLDSCDVVGNRAGENGGGILYGGVARSTVELSGTGRIAGNVSDGSGGGIFCKPSTQTGAMLRLSGTQEITGNHAVKSGGGCCVGLPGDPFAGFQAAGDVRIQGNTADSDGISGGTGGVYLNAISIGMSGKVVIDGNSAPETAGFLTNDLQLADGRIINLNGGLDAGSMVRVNTVSNEKTIVVANSSGGDIPESAVGVFVPERREYKAKADGTDLLFTTADAADMQVALLIDGHAARAGTLPEVFAGEGQPYVKLSSMAGVLSGYGFGMDRYDGESVFGFLDQENGQVVVLPAEPVRDGGDWKIPVPEDEALRKQLVYLPNGAEPGTYRYQDMVSSNGFWSVTVNDALGTMNNDVEDLSSVRYVPAGGSTSLSLPVRSGDWAWSVDKPVGDGFKYDMRTEGDVVGIAIRDIHAPVTIRSGEMLGSTYTAQYYAYIASFKDGSVEYNTALKVIDTRGNGDGTGGHLPKNGDKNPPLMNLRLDSGGNVIKVSTLKEIYSSSRFGYSSAPQFIYADKLVMNGRYDLVELWVLKEGRLPASTDRGDWTIYNRDVLGLGSIHDLKLTNDPDMADGNDTIYLADGAVIRFVYRPDHGKTDSDAKFYDYDISDGYIYGDKDWTKQLNTSAQAGLEKAGQRIYPKTTRQGINDTENYGGTGAKLAFGNRNVNTGRGDESVGGLYINGSNKGNFSGCYFGLADRLDDAGNLVYASGIDAPDLFGDGPAKGKTEVDLSLRFSRTGDTYTLDAVNGTGVAGLSRFSHPGSYMHIWTNHFWPMDDAATWGADGHDLKFGDPALRVERGSDLPVSDDGKDHNSYFGTEDLTGQDIAEREVISPEALPFIVTAVLIVRFGEAVLNDFA